MPDLYITTVTPNPAGKDRTPANQVTNTQLNGEWLEFQNTSQRALSLDGVSLCHYTFDNFCRKTGEDILTGFHGSLAAGRRMRVHTGSGQPWPEGTIHHVYVGRSNFAWNNRCGDTALLRHSAGHNIDWAGYDPNPGEGAVLLRVPNTNKLA